MIEKVQYRKKLASGMASFAFLAFGTLVLLSSPGINIDSITNVLIKTAPAILVLGLLGYVIGNIIDHRSRKIIPLEILEKEDETYNENLGNVDEGMDNKNGEPDEN